ncbi:MAG: cobalamin B12-binding domain-containing protein [Parvularculaceae bacterium]|nr:cobalamin B12-binding domain-containing protein [Parvularculaceae bacterium]
MPDFFQGAQAGAGTNSRSEGVLMPFLQLGDRLKKAKSADAHPESRDILVRTIEGEIIPRLMLTLADADEKGITTEERFLSPTEEDRTQFIWSVMNESAASSRAFVSGLVTRGVPREAIYLDLLTGAARRLGEMWERDEADFTDVTIGLCRLHQILREQGAIGGAAMSPGGEMPSILLGTSGEEKHVFGVVMVSEFFRRAGWRVWSEPAAALPELTALVAREWFHAVGLSAACETSESIIAQEIAALRAASKNKELVVMVGGSLFNQNPALAKSVGADATASDGKAAVELGQRLVAAALQHG